MDSVSVLPVLRSIARANVFLIGIWGGENRLYAAIKFFLYTLVGSVVMLLGVLKMYFLTQDATLAAKISQAHC